MIRTKNGPSPWVLVFLLALGVGSLSAHAPKAVNLAYTHDTATLKVTITHPVKNPEKHFVDRIRVFVNKDQVAEKTYDKQESSTTHSETFTLSGIQPGDTIMVKVSCNKFGGKRATLTVT